MSKYNWTPIKSYTDILFDFFEGIARITINRPKVYNAFRPLTNMEMLDAMSICRERSDIRVVVLTESATRPSAAAATSMPKAAADMLATTVCRASTRSTCTPPYVRFPSLVIAMVNGYAIGGGNVLQVVCDLSIASSTARFGQTDPRLAVSTPVSARRIWHVV